MGGKIAYNLVPEERVRPAALDSWGDPGALQHYTPIPFRGRIEKSAVEANDIEGLCFLISITDNRSEHHFNQDILRIPVGIRIPYKKGTRAYGLKEMYLAPEIIDAKVTSQNFPPNWYYLEAELFGGRRSSPVDLPSGPYATQRKEIHCGAPMALYQEPDNDRWCAFAAEPDYGAAILWREDHLLFYTTLYLRPGDTSEWSFCQWSQIDKDPANVFLSATRPGGFFDHLNPPQFNRKGPPEGPIAFININRPDEHFEQLQKIRPKMVMLNFHYDHVSSVADLYGEWTTYEGFEFSETKLKALISKIKAMGAKVGFYGTQVEQHERHSPVRKNDFTLDRFGRRIQAWEPDSWIADCGNGDLADRLARAEAEFAAYYGMECVFVDRQDHMSVNANPDRTGLPDSQRLACIPSVRLGLIELNKRRVFWQRKLNPDLIIGINNTTQWVGGVRYADFNLLEGGMDLDPPIFFLTAPFGLIHKQHYNLFFADFETAVVDHGIVQSERAEVSFNEKRKRLFRICLADGVIPQPYEDEIFVDPHSQFARGWNDRTLPDEEKFSFYNKIEFYGGDQWRKDCETIAEAMKVASCKCFPVAKVWSKPDMGRLPVGCRFSAREGPDGSFFMGIFNGSGKSLEVDVRVGTLEVRQSIPANLSKAWYRGSPDDTLRSCQL